MNQPVERGLLDEPLRRLLAPRTANPLASAGLKTVEDLLFHFPRRLDHWGEVVPFGRLTPGEYVTVYARAVSGSKREISGGRFLVTGRITDGVRELKVTKFAPHQRMATFFAEKYQSGRHGFFSGEVTKFNRELQLTHPREDFLDDEADEQTVRSRSHKPVPIYPATRKAPSHMIAKSVATVLGPLQDDDIPDPLPAAVRAERGYPSRLTSLRQVHQPDSDEEFYRALARFRYEEAFFLQAGFVRRRRELAATPAVPRPVRAGGLVDALDASLPFALTSGQDKVGAELAGELAGRRPMNRLLQGEVGSGKTLVALRAMLQVVDAGGQAALLAPTEVLASQHLRSITALLGPLAEEGLMADDGPHVVVRLLTGAMGAAARKRALLDAASGQAGIVIGTHALLSDPVQFADLGLVIVDEQHRFGVEQRDKLRSKAGSPPHMLVMTATPIPRTVAMTVFGDLDVSTLAELPAGRPGITTHLVPADKPAWVERCWTRIREEVDAGRRAFVVCPKISPAQEEADAEVPEEQDSDGEVPRPPAANVEETQAMLQRVPALAGIGIGALHGRMSPEDKDRAMADFVAGRTAVLVATTVIEVGVDVPAASVMVVLDADRFGLSQLHQLRGRVGRGAVPGLCLLVSHDAGGDDNPAGQRLAALASSADGFELAEQDLKIRREGDVLGDSQSGTSSLRVLRVIHDAATIAQARTDAERLLEDDPELAGEPLLAAEIERRLADREEYLDRS